MKKNVAYLFGAGASANALPVVKYFNQRLNRFLKFLKSVQEYHLPIKDLIVATESLLIESQRHSTIDTVAKKYYHSHNKYKLELENLKKVLSSFFFYEQLFTKVYSSFSELMELSDIDEKELTNVINNKTGNIDNRYDSFIASLLSNRENKFLLPNNISILTWNYDCQFELAFKQFCDESFYQLQQRLNVFPFITPESHEDHWKNIGKDTFKILHLNGQAHNFFKKEANSKFQSSYDFSLNENQIKIEEILELLDDVFRKVDPKNLTFSWERNAQSSLRYEEVNIVIEESKRIMKKAEILVIAGYSFPFFNRDVDRELLEGQEFEKIYIQDKNASNIKTQLINIFNPQIRESDIIEYDNVDQFLLPPEFDGEYPEQVIIPMRVGKW